MTVAILPGRGVLVMLQGKHEGVTVMLPETMSIAAIEKHLAEVREFLA